MIARCPLTLPSPHQNNLIGIPDSWSIKYNLLWQKILMLDGPFPWDTVIPRELAYYKTKANKQVP